MTLAKFTLNRAAMALPFLLCCKSFQFCHWSKFYCSPSGKGPNWFPGNQILVPLMKANSARQEWNKCGVLKISSVRPSYQNQIWRLLFYWSARLCERRPLNSFLLLTLDVLKVFSGHSPGIADYFSIFSQINFRLALPVLTMLSSSAQSSPYDYGTIIFRQFSLKYSPTAMLCHNWCSWSHDGWV